MRTIKSEKKIEFEEKKSRFIGRIKPVNTKKDAEYFINEIKSKHEDATHNCSVYKIIEDGKEYSKSDDDGEPKGTAGKSMEQTLSYMNIDNVVIVATRYFGGIKLGAGGLIRAYSKTARLVVQASEIVEFVNKEKYILEFSYSMIEEIDRMLVSCDVFERGFNDRVFYKVNLTEKVLEKLKLMKDVLIIRI